MGHSKPVSHPAGFLYKKIFFPKKVNETALRDCAATIRREHRLAKTTGPEGLLALRDALREKQ